MAEYIERERLITEIRAVQKYYLVSEVAVNIIKHLPSADVAEVVHGKWEKFDQECEVEYACSNCNFSIVEADPKQDCVFNYCPICGAKMDGNP